MALANGISDFKWSLWQIRTELLSNMPATHPIVFETSPFCRVVDPSVIYGAAATDECCDGGSTHSDHMFLTDQTPFPILVGIPLTSNNIVRNEPQALFFFHGVALVVYQKSVSATC